MTLEEMKTLADAYELQKKEKASSSSSSSSDSSAAVAGKPDLSHVYAPSNDPRKHADGGAAAAVGKVYTLSEEEVGRYFPGPWSKPGRVPWEAGLQSVLATKFLLVRPQAIEVIESLKKFGERSGREGGMEGAEKLREEWVKKGGLAAAMAGGGKGGGEEVGQQQEQQQQRQQEQKVEVAAAGGVVGGEGGGEEGEEEDDEYELFGEEEDDEEQVRKGKKAAGGGGRAGGREGMRSRRRIGRSMGR